MQCEANAAVRNILLCDNCSRYHPGPLASQFQRLGYNRYYGGNKSRVSNGGGLYAKQQRMTTCVMTTPLDIAYIAPRAKTMWYYCMVCGKKMVWQGCVSLLLVATPLGMYQCDHSDF